MNKAKPCKVCGTDRHLQWKTYAEREWWIHCDQCGQEGMARQEIAQAGEAWNAQQAGTANAEVSHSHE